MRLQEERSLFLGALFFVSVFFSSRDVLSVEDDYEFMPLHAWRILGETGEDDATTRLAEGFPGLKSEPGKNHWIEPVDGAGGFDNVAPRLSREEGPGGLEWDPSPTYRTRYKNGTDYTTSSTNPQGNNWFTRIPYCQYDSTNDEWVVRFDANTFRVYTNESSGTYVGKYGNSNSKLKQVGFYRYLYDIGGKTYTFLSTGRCLKIQGVGGSETTFSYNGTSSITVLQKPSSTSGSEVRKFTYTLEASGTRIDKIDVAEKDGASWNTYRTIDFTYHDNVSGAVGSSSGDLIGIEDTKDLSESTKTYTRKWVFKYYTGTYNESTNPGYPYQVEAVLGPGSVDKFEDENPSLNIYKRSASQLASYVDQTYEYFSDRRLKELVLKSHCGCGGASGTYTYANWTTNGSASDLNTWSAYVEITLPSGGKRILDYNKYGQTLNSVLQEVAGNPSSRRWIRTYRHDTTGRLTDSYSVSACSSYSAHSVTTNTTDGMHTKYTYDTNSALNTVKLRDPSSGDWNWQRKKVWTLKTSGDRKRFLKTSDTIYPTETASDAGKATGFTYSYHSSDALAPEKRTTDLPAVATGENGSGSQVYLYDYFESDGLHTWSKDGEGYVHYKGYDSDRRTVTKTVRDIDTDAGDRPSGVPAPPDATFQSSTGLNIVTDMEYDALRRVTKRQGPAFDAWTGSSVTSTRTTPRWHYSKLSGGELVVLKCAHIDDTSFYDAAVEISVHDHEGNVVTSALGDCSDQDTNLDDDFDETQSTLSAAFTGTIVQRTDFIYDGRRLTKKEVWSDADNGSASKFTTTNTYDSSGRLETATTPAGTITRYTYDVLGREKSTKVGTIDGGVDDNMVLVEELFYDDEEDTTSNVGDGFLTEKILYADYEGAGSPRTTDYSYDYRGRMESSSEPLDVGEERDYDNLGRVTEVRRYDDNTSTLMAKTKSYYDAREQLYETRTYGISGGSGTGYTKVEYWRDARGLTIKTLRDGKVFEKAEYDGAGRVINRATCYDTDETAYADADDLTGDTVIEETSYVLDATGASELAGHYQRRHNGTGTGSLTVGSSGNGRAQYTATWYDELHRKTNLANYGTNGGTDLTSRPSGNPPSSSDSDKLVTTYTYTIKSQVEDANDPKGITGRTEYTDWGAVSKKIDNYGDGSPGPNSDDDRTVEYTYNSDGQLWKTTAKASTNDQVTEYVYGTTLGNSKIASNDLLFNVKYPDPSTGAPGGDADTVRYDYNTQGERTYEKELTGTMHVYRYDDRGRLEHDEVAVLGSGLDGSVRRITWSYDALDRPVTVSAYDTAAVGQGDVVNEVEYEYDKFGVVKKVYQEWTGTVNTSTSPYVEYLYSLPTDGTTALRRTSTTYPGDDQIDDVYSSGTDDTISRLTGQKHSSNWLFQESYLGLGRLVEREFGDTGTFWTLVGTDTANNDNYVGLDRFGRIDELVIWDGSTNFNRYLYTYNYNSQVTLREDTVGNLYGYYIFDEGYQYDDLGRVTDHLRGNYNGSWNQIGLHECWTLDRSGNATEFFSSTSSDCENQTQRSFNASNETSTTGFGFNVSGDQTDSPGSQTMVYDAWNRLVEYKSDSTTLAAYEYNGLGQKIKRTDSQTLEDTYYYYSGSQVVEEQKVSDGSTVYWYVWGTQYIDDIVVRHDGTDPEYSAPDANFSVVTRLDANGDVLKRHFYTAYGMPKQLSADWMTWGSVTEDLYLFQGRQFLLDHAQIDFRNRKLSPEEGRFVQRDPIWRNSGNFGNGYVFTAADPVNPFLQAGQQTGRRCVLEGKGTNYVQQFDYQGGHWGAIHIECMTDPNGIVNGFTSVEGTGALQILGKRISLCRRKCAISCSFDRQFGWCVITPSRSGRCGGGGVTVTMNPVVSNRPGKASISVTTQVTLSNRALNINTSRQRTCSYTCQIKQGENRGSRRVLRYRAAMRGGGFGSLAYDDGS